MVSEIYNTCSFIAGLFVLILVLMDNGLGVKVTTQTVEFATLS